MTIKHPTREGWLLAARELLQTEFFKGEYTLPKKVACSCGFPRGTNKAIGQCWSPEVSSDGTTNLFICPTQAEPVRVLDILLHELGHAALGVEAKHGSKFRKWALGVGLAGKMTATFAEEGTDLHKVLVRMARELGQYPHAAMSKKAAKAKKSTNGWIRVKSLTDEDYKVMVSPKMAEEHGMPRDPWGEEMVPLDYEGDE